MKSMLKQFWLWRANDTMWPWIESVIITAIILYCCYLLHPDNPLAIHAIFPWPWIAAIIVVLQYGYGPALLSVAIVAVIAVLMKNAGMLSMVDFQSYILSGITLILLCALFSSNWIRRVINAEELLHYTNERLNSLSRSYYMLRISYDYLEHNVITKPQTLRLVMHDLQQLVAQTNGKLTADVVYRFLQLITQYCSVTTVGVYLYENKTLLTHPVAEIGAMGQLNTCDPLILYALDTREICYVSINKLENINECKYLVAIPMRTSDDDLIGLFVIKEMSFWSLTDETLRILSMLIAYFTEDVIVTTDISAFLYKFPDCPPDFGKQLKKLLRLKKDLNIDSALVAVIVDKCFRVHNVIANLKGQHRFLDSFWSLEKEDYDVLITLLPFTEAAGICGFQTRISDFLKIDLGLSFSDEQIKMRSMQLYVSDAVTIMDYFLNFIGTANRA